MKLYCLYDRVAQKHLPPWQSENDATCKRALLGALRSDESLSKNHADYDVFYLGEYDLMSGLITAEHIHAFALTQCLIDTPVAGHPVGDARQLFLTENK